MLLPTLQLTVYFFCLHLHCYTLPGKKARQNLSNNNGLNSSIQPKIQIHPLQNNIHVFVGVPSSQALPGYLITAPPSVCVPAVLGALAVRIEKQKTKCHTKIIMKERKNNTTNNYNFYIHYQHTNRSLQNNIPHPKYNPNIRIHPLQNNIHVSKVHCGSAFEPGASRLPYYCTSTCVRSSCNWRASCVDSKPKKKEGTGTGNS